MRPAAAARPRRRSVLAGLLMVLVLLTALGLALWVGLDQLLAGWGDVPLSITIDGERVVEGAALGPLGTGARLAIVLGALLLLALMALVLPLLLALAIAAVLVLLLVAVLVAVGAPAIAAASAVLVIGLLVVAPVLLLARLLRRLWRGSPSATINP